jgi:hypothetical protein
MTEPPAPLMLALFEPDIAQNAGAIMRTCACLGAEAAIIEPAGFRLSDSRSRRAGMDYLDALTLVTHDSWTKFAAWRASSHRRLVLLTTKGETCLWDFAFREGDIISRRARVGGRARDGQRSSGRAGAHSNSSSPTISQCWGRRGHRVDRGSPPDRTIALTGEGDPLLAGKP